MMSNKVKNILLFLVICQISMSAVAQDEVKVKDIFHAVSQKYDALPDMSFDVSFTVRTGVAGEKPIEDKLTGRYVLSGKKAFYHIGQTEAVLNDSFLVAVYNEDKFIVVTNARDNNNARFFPFRETMDSLVNLSAERYEIKNTRENNTGMVSFKAKNGHEPVTGFFMKYGKSDMLLYSLQYDSKEYRQAENDAKSDAPVLVNKTMLVEFSGYNQTPVRGDIFEESRYIEFKNGEWAPAAKYEGYQLYYNRPPQMN